MMISQATTLNFTVYWNRPAGTSRSDLLDVIVSGAGLLPAQQPLRGLAVNNNNFAQALQVNINPASVPGAGRPGGVVVRGRATAGYTTDAFYLGCLCFRPASWTFETEVPVRVIYRGVQPTITQQPANRAVTAGQTANFTVAAKGQGLSYQWLRGGVAVNGATGTSYTTAALATTDNGASFVARVCTTLANPVETACVNSNAAQLTVTAATVAPTFSTAPQSITVTEGETVSFSAIANGQPAPAIGWSRLDSGGFGTVYTPVCGVTTGTGSLTSASCNLGQLTRASNGLRVEVEVGNGQGVANPPARVATLTVNSAPAAPTISLPLAKRAVLDGAQVSFSVAATGTPATFSYGWALGGAAVPRIISGCTAASASCSFTAMLEDSGKTMAISVANGVAPDAQSSATLTVTTNDVAATIITQPASQSVVAGNSATPTPTLVTLPTAAPAGMSLLAGDFSAGGGGGSADGTGTAARFDSPEGLTADRSGNLFVAQSNASRISKIASDGVVTTIYRPAGASNTNFGSLAFAADGSLYTAAVSWCGLVRTPTPPTASSVTQALTVTGCPTIETRGIAVASNGVVHISQANGSVSRIGTPDVNGNAVATVFVGAVDPYVAPGSVDANGMAARFRAPRGIAFDVYGNLFVADAGNHTIRRITPNGDVTSFVGTPGVVGTADGNGAAARFNNPTELAFDGAGVLYVLERGDASNSFAVIVRRVTPTGDVTTLFNAGNEAAALAASGQETFARTIRGKSLIGSDRLAFTAGNAVLVRTLP